MIFEEKILNCSKGKIGKVGTEVMADCPSVSTQSGYMTLLVGMIITDVKETPLRRLLVIDNPNYHLLDMETEEFVSVKLDHKYSLIGNIVEENFTPKKYMLIDVYERDIHTDIFDSKEKAIDAMESRFIESCGLDSMTEVTDRYESDNDYCLNKETMSGWSNVHDENWDWLIVEI